MCQALGIQQWGKRETGPTLRKGTFQTGDKHPVPGNHYKRQEENKAGREAIEDQERREEWVTLYKMFREGPSGAVRDLKKKTLWRGVTHQAQKAEGP